MNYVFCLGHGVGVVIGEEKGLPQIRLSNQMMVFSKNFRELASANEVDLFYVELNKKIIPSRETWNRRYREYMSKIKTGSLLSYAQIINELRTLKKTKTLSFGERKMLESTSEVISQELAIVTRKDQLTIKNNLLNS